MMNNTSAEFREWATRCEDRAAATSNENERAGLLRKREALLALADQEDWLAGLPGSCSLRAAEPGFPIPNRQQAAE